MIKIEKVFENIHILKMKFPPYPPPQKSKSKKDFMTMVSNVSARKKWLTKYAPDWRGPEIWSKKRVKKYIYDIKNGRKPLPVAKREKIPWAWGCKMIIPIATVVESEPERITDVESEPERITDVESEPERIDIASLIFRMGICFDDGLYNDFL